MCLHRRVNERKRESTREKVVKTQNLRKMIKREAERALITDIARKQHNMLVHA